MSIARFGKLMITGTNHVIAAERLMGVYGEIAPSLFPNHGLATVYLLSFISWTDWMGAQHKSEVWR